MFTSPFTPGEKVPRIKALMAFFNSGEGAKKLTAEEIKALSDDERNDLARHVGEAWNIDVMC